jgi:ABC-2 type transport system permease protein
MSTSMANPPVPVNTPTPERFGPTQGRALISEFIKMRTLRSTTLTLAAAVLGLAGLGLLISFVTNRNFDHFDPARLARFDPIGRSLGGVNIAQLAIGVLGVLLVTGEYSTGMIKATFAAIPTRYPVLWAKAGLYATVTAALMIPAAFVAFLGGQELLGVHGTTLSAPSALRAVFGVGLYLTVVAVLAVALGFLIRSTAGGIATLFGVLLVLPGLGNLLPTDWQTNILPYLPSNAGSALYTVHPDNPGTLAPWTGFAVMCLWAVIALAAAAVTLKRRDV